MYDAQISPMAVAFQAIGTLLLAAMLAQLARIYAWRYVRRWAWAWALLFLALGSVRVYITTLASVWWVAFLVAEWTYLVLLYAGCREIADGREVELRRVVYLLPLAVVAAALLTYLSDTFNDLFTVQAAIVAAGALSSFLILGRVGELRRTAGWQTMRLSLALIAILYASYVPLYAVHEHFIDLTFLPYAPLADLLAAVFLGFSMILITAEHAQRDLQDAVSALQVARDQIEEKLRIDPLTAALNRHAFHTIQRGMTGVVVMLDIDHLKQINDEVGHAAGDAVIRATANAVRGRIRADDLLFRWGGDEFLLILPGSNLSLVRERLSALDRGIRVAIPGGKEIEVSISWGGAEFGPSCALDEAMRAADAEMYGRRSAARAG